MAWNRVLITLVVAAVPTGALEVNSASAEDKGGANWPSFRGPNASGVADGYPTPTQWNVEKSENVAWKSPIPGLGHSSPIVWGDRIFVSSAVGDDKSTNLRVGLYGDIAPVPDEAEHRWMVYCLNKRSGKLLWEREAHRGVPKVKRHTKATHANSTPATDGQYVVAFFGSEGLYCFTMDGELKWKKDFGVLDAGYYVVPQAQWEFGSSPIIHDGKVIVQCDVQKDSFLAALDVKDGNILWKTSRDEVPTWGSPTMYEHGGKKIVAVNGYKHIGGYDFATGAEVWKMKGGGDIPVPTPIVAGGLIYLTNAHGAAAPIYAVRLSATGDISLGEDQTSNSHVAWAQMRTGNYMQTPLVYGDLFYACRDNGAMSVLDAKTGEKKYRDRLREGVGFTASPVAADGKVYFTTEEGEVFVIQAGPKISQPTRNPLGEICMATPAISEGMLFFRTQHHLIAVAQRATPATGSE